MSSTVHEQIDSFRGVARRAGNRTVGPPSETMLKQAHQIATALFKAGVVVYRAICGADCTVGLFIQQPTHHVEVECLGDEGVSVEWGYRRDNQPIYDYYEGDRVVERVVLAILERGSRA